MSAARIDRYGGAHVFDVVANADRPVVAEGQLIGDRVSTPVTWCSIGSPAQIDPVAVSGAVRVR